MSESELEKSVRARLNRVLEEMIAQRDSVSGFYAAGQLPFNEEMAQIAEFLGPARELGVGYECIVANLESVPFRLTSGTAIALLEAGLLLRFKTDRDEDKIYDCRL